MPWQIHTAFRKIGVGTDLHFIESPTIPGYAAPITVGSNVHVELALGAVTVIRILSVDLQEITIQDADNKTWRLTPHTDGDFPTGVSSPGLNSQDWVVRSEIQG